MDIWMFEKASKFAFLSEHFEKNLHFNQNLNPENDITEDI